MDPQVRTELAELARRAKQDGRYEDAASFYRQIYRDGETDWAAKKLAGSLRHTGVEALRRGEFLAAVEQLREAWDAWPQDQKLRRQYLRALRGAAAQASRNRSYELATELFDEARRIEPSDDLIEGLARAHRSLVLDLEHRAHGPSLVVVEHGVDQVVLSAILSNADLTECYAESPLPFFDAAVPTCEVKRLDRAFVGGPSAEDDLRLRTDVIASNLIEVVRGTIGDKYANELDLIDMVSNELADTVFVSARRSMALRDVISHGNFKGVLFIVGHGGIWEAFEQHARAAFGPDNVQAFACSEQRSVYGPLDGPHSISGLTASYSRKVRVSPFKKIKDAARRFVMKHSSTGGDSIATLPRGHVGLLATADKLHVDNLARIAEALPPAVDVVALPMSPVDKYPQMYAPYQRLHGERPRTMITPHFADSSVEKEEKFARLEHKTLETSMPPLADLDGVNIWPILRYRIEQRFTGRLLRAELFAREFDRYLREAQPSVLLVSPDRNGDARIACALAKRHGVPSVFPQVVLYSDSPRYSRFHAEYFTVIDDYTFDLFTQKFRVPDDKVFLTGIARFDPIIEAEAVPLEPAPDGNSVVLLALQSLGVEVNDALVDAVIEAVSKLEGVKLVIKLHPSDNADNQRRYADLLRERAGEDAGWVVWRGDVHKLLARSMVVVSAFSNVVLEAAMFQRLVVCANFGGEPLPIPFVEQGLAVLARSPKDIERRLEDLLYDDGARVEARRRQAEYFERNPHLREGHAAERIARLILGLEGRQRLPSRQPEMEVSH